MVRLTRKCTQRRRDEKVYLKGQTKNAVRLTRKKKDQKVYPMAHVRLRMEISTVRLTSKGPVAGG